MENKTKKKEDAKKPLLEEIVFPSEINFTLEEKKLTVVGPKGELHREFRFPGLQLKKEADKLILTSKKTTKREKKTIKTAIAHIKNLIKGVTEGFSYKMKICASHFPMNVSVKGNSFEVKNYIGEKVPRVLKLKEGVTVKVNGEEVLIESTNKELAGQTAGDIEQLTRRNGFDRRVFQDGIYITEKDGKVL